MSSEDGKRMISIENDKITSALLLGQKSELIIEHNEEHYRLRITGNGKLILTK